MVHVYVGKVKIDFGVAVVIAMALILIFLVIKRFLYIWCENAWEKDTSAGILVNNLQNQCYFIPNVPLYI